MGCEDGSCATYRLGALIWCLITGAAMAVGLLWIEGHRVWASVCVLVPVMLFWKGEKLSRAADCAYLSARDAWRAKARRPGRLYCPECAEELGADGECAKCRGAWLSADALGALCWPLGRKAADWKARGGETSWEARCPRCAGALEEGDVTSVPSVFSRCAACDGFWAPRVTRLWFEVNAPARRA